MTCFGLFHILKSIINMLRTTLLLFISLMALPSIASQITLPSTPIAIKDDKNFDDLAAFGQAIGNKSIVVLDELTHGEAEVFALKSRLVKYLHQHKGFDVLLLESGLYDVNKIWQNPNKSIRSQAKGNIFYMYAADQSILSLFDYIDSNRKQTKPLELQGFDGRLSGKYAIADVANVIKSKSLSNSAIANNKIDWQRYSAMTTNIIKRQGQQYNAEQRQWYVETSKTLITALNRDQGGFDSGSYVARLIRGLVIVAENMWQQRRFDEHDIAMADNVQWLLENKLKGKKVIIWGHYIHVNRAGWTPNLNDNLGSMLEKRYPNQIYFTHFTAASGKYREFRDGTVVTIKPNEDIAFETTAINAVDSPPRASPFASFVTPQKLPSIFNDDMLMHGIDYKSSIKVSDWSAHFDGVFILNKISASN